MPSPQSLAVVLAALALGPAEAPPADPPGDGGPHPVRLRIVAANITSGNLQSYPLPGPGARIFEALGGDVVLLQELNVHSTPNAPNDEAAVRAFVDQVFGPDFHVFREPGGDQIPNGIVSRWPIVEAGEWDDPEVDNRDFAFARIDLPGEVDLWAVSLHLLTRSSGARDAEARAVVERVRALVPEDDYLVIGGDFNTRRREESAIRTLGEVVDILGPFPDDGNDPPDEDTNAGRARPLDWVLVDGDLEAHAVATEIGGLAFPAGLVFDSRIFTQEELDESFPPVRREDSGAPMMQHMAVVRDFLIPVEGAPVAGFRVEPARLDFGAVDAADGPFRDATARLVVPAPMQLTAASLTGSHPAEFVLAEPDLSAGPVALDADTELTFVWSPPDNDGAARSVVASLIGDADPGAVEIELAGRPRPPAVAGAPVDLSGFRLLQTGGDAVLVFPPGTALEAGRLLVVGRAASRAEFEAFWGPLDPAVVYVDGETVAGSPGFPILNGGERFRLVDAAGEAVDPSSDQLPAAGTRVRRSYERPDTGSPDFAERDPSEATPGRYAGTRSGSGGPVITEISDAGDFRLEFVEILFDAAPDG